MSNSELKSIQKISQLLVNFSRKKFNLQYFQSGIFGDFLPDLIYFNRRWIRFP